VSVTVVSSVSVEGASEESQPLGLWGASQPVTLKNPVIKKTKIRTTLAIKKNAFTSTSFHQ
jgi:hypothetical protein